MKKFSFLFVLFFSLFFGLGSYSVEASVVNAYLFYGEGCPHCAKERQFLNRIKDQNLTLYEFEIYHSYNNALLMQKVAETLKVDAGGVPFLIIGDKSFIGFGEGITDTEIEAQINKCLKSSCPDSIAGIVGVEEKEVTNSITTESGQGLESENKIINLPFLGSIDAHNFSLPVLAVVMGVLDGFNPCAMWVLLFLISLLLGMENKKRMWILGATFIISSASVYFIFMSAWLNLILFLGFVIWVRAIIGILALVGGGYNLKEFLFNKDNGCKVAGDEKRQRIFEKLKSVISQKSFLFALGGIIALVFMVNLVELICSAGLPAVLTQVLALNELAKWQYYFYILLYIFFFMLDDLFVFFVAMITLQMTGITTKYSRWSHLIGGILMLIIGLLLLFKPEWLMFG